MCVCVLGPSLTICLLLKVTLNFLKAAALGQIKCSQGIIAWKQAPWLKDTLLPSLRVQFCTLFKFIQQIVPQCPLNLMTELFNHMCFTHIYLHRNQVFSLLLRFCKKEYNQSTSNAVTFWRACYSLWLKYLQAIPKHQLFLVIKVSAGYT